MEPDAPPPAGEKKSRTCLKIGIGCAVALPLCVVLYVLANVFYYPLLVRLSSLDQQIVLEAASDDPAVLARTRQFLLEPELAWERVGIIPNVCFPTAAVVRDGRLLVYYGGADRVVGLATADLDELLDYLLT